MREIRTSGSPSGDWKRSRSKSGNAGPPPRQSSTLSKGLILRGIRGIQTRFWRIFFSQAEISSSDPFFCLGMLFLTCFARWRDGLADLGRVGPGRSPPWTKAGSLVPLSGFESGCSGRLYEAVNCSSSASCKRTASARPIRFSHRHRVEALASVPSALLGSITSALVAVCKTDGFRITIRR